jgi:tetratricopeptide (TPR) repeat protein
MSRHLIAGVLGMTLVSAACASVPPAPTVTAPKFPAFPTPVVPDSLGASAELRERHEIGWRRLQAGDLRGAVRDFNQVLERAPAFYPAATGRGFARLASGDYDEARDDFAMAVRENDAYLPAWQGLAEAQIEVGAEVDAIASLERVVALDPSQAEPLRSRIELLRFRQVQALIQAGRRAREANRLDEAHANFERALRLSPDSAILHRDLAGIERDRGQLDAAEAQARQAVGLDAADADAHALLGSVLEAQGRLADASDAYAEAASIQPRAEWRERSADLRNRARLATLPDEFGSIATAPTVTRAHVAALIGLRLDRLLAAAPRRAAGVATDVRGHWAASWILPVTQAGIMEIFPNHTFQPGATVRRGDLARVVQELVTLVSGERPDEVTRWAAARPQFADLPPSNLYYRPAALAVSAGVLRAADERFRPTEPAPGSELLAAMTRIEQLLGR